MLLVYDITSKTSFDKLDEWKAQFESINNMNYNNDNNNNTTFYLLLGNKIDLGENQREVTTNQALNYARQSGMEHLKHQL